MLLVCVAALLGLYVAFFLLVQAPSLRLTPTYALQHWPVLGRLADALTPESLLMTSWTMARATVYAYAYLLVVLALIGVWGAALWLVRPGAGTLGLPSILGIALLFSVPLMLLPGLLSGDIYLYMFYGRIIAHYGENPILVPPNQFPGDPLLDRVFWGWLPSSYGPVWLLLSGLVSTLAGESLWTNLLTYKGVALLAHLLTVVVVWALLRRTQPGLATWAAVFYGWNPLVLIEGVGNGHNDVLIGLFMALALLAAVHRYWLVAVFILVAATMVKLFVVLMLPVLVVAWLRSLPEVGQRLRAGIAAAGAAALSAIVLYAPLWGGTALLQNVRNNPASREYQNSLWELLVLEVISPDRDPRISVFHSSLDVARYALLVAVYALLLWRLWRGMGLLDAMIWAWFAYFLCIGWIWPWYFLPAVPVAAAAGPSRTAAVVAALTLGGLLFWLGWPEPALPAAAYFHDYRSVLLLVPAILVAIWPMTWNTRRAVQRRTFSIPVEST